MEDVALQRAGWSQADFNSVRLQKNAGRFGLAATKTRKHIARLKTRRAFTPPASATLNRLGQQRRIAHRPWERTLHARERSAQVQWLITELDRLFFELLGLRENQLVRRTVWSNRFRY
ncbi:transposase [Bradyrhizobium sp. CIR18]|uniref:hypothetical protein n=1 Tax=Bradyrhizobium sp. CIR18 TaxID=2663839 RepID=UPI001605A546|nr:hypothetical protein [Bradyrhizobium sp. CIR18]MBB4365311.1 transposase [Bradyrhizobium sp. CIR18]